MSMASISVNEPSNGSIFAFNIKFMFRRVTFDSVNVISVNINGCFVGERVVDSVQARRFMGIPDNIYQRVCREVLINVNVGSINHVELGICSRLEHYIVVLSIVSQNLIFASVSSILDDAFSVSELEIYTWFYDKIIDDLSHFL